MTRSITVSAQKIGGCGYDDALNRLDADFIAARCPWGNLSVNTQNSAKGYIRCNHVTLNPTMEIPKSCLILYYDSHVLHCMSSLEDMLINTFYVQRRQLLVRKSSPSKFSICCEQVSCLCQLHYKYIPPHLFQGHVLSEQNEDCVLTLERERVRTLCRTYRRQHFSLGHRNNRN